MSYELFPHQITGAKFLSESKGTKGLFFGMGTGKTITALEACRKVAPAGPILIIAPPIALPMWKSEVENYLGVHAQILKTGTTRQEEYCDVLVVSYAIATKRRDELQKWLGGDGILICDESHALKTPTAKRTKAILGHGGIANGADYVWLLTGTPITRWNDDVYAFLCRADLAGLKERVGGTDFFRFQMNFCLRRQRQYSQFSKPVWQTYGNQNTAELADWIYGEGHAIRVDLEEVFKDMPPITHNRYAIKLEADAVLRDELKALSAMSIAEIEKLAGSKEEHLATILRQLGLSKVKAAAEEIAERIESGQNILVAALHTSVIDELEKILSNKGYTTGIIDGRASAGIKDDLQNRWNRGEIQCLIGQIHAMGVSLNLQQGGSQIIVVEEDWSYEVMQQMYARLWRYGQKKHVHVDTLHGDTKLEQALYRINQTKGAEAAKFNAIGREHTNA